MQESGASDEQARDQIKELLTLSWKNLYKKCFKLSHLPKTFINAATNITRCYQFMNQHGDGFGAANSRHIEAVKSLLINPIPIHKM
ncbi:hypothetical protein AMTRI_Chr11g99770 [Amborella trichopoda]